MKEEGDPSNGSLHEKAAIARAVRCCSACERPGCRRDRPSCPGRAAPADPVPWPPAGDRLAQAAWLRARIDGLKREISDWQWLRAELDRRVIANQVALVLAEEQLAQVRAGQGLPSGVK